MFVSLVVFLVILHLYKNCFKTLNLHGGVTTGGHYINFPHLGLVISSWKQEDVRVMVGQEEHTDPQIKGVP